MKIDEMMLSEAGKRELGGNLQAGCTATVALITPNEIYCCNAGDSRTVLSKGKQAVDLSVDHKPDDAEEHRRIVAANGFVEDSRVNGMLALSRALGDFEYKNNRSLKAKDQAVTAFPDVKCVQITQDTEFILLACDGIWDVMTSQVGINFIHKNVYNDNFPVESKKRTVQQLVKGVEAIMDECCAKDLTSCGGLGCDNMTVILVEIRNQQ